jgi:Ca2+-binding RTX toxin-like protein
MFDSNLNYMDSPGEIDNVIGLNVDGLGDSIAWGNMANNQQMRQMAAFLAHELLHPLNGLHASGGNIPTYQQMVDDQTYRDGFKVFGELGGTVLVSVNGGLPSYRRLAGTAPVAGTAELSENLFVKAMAAKTASKGQVAAVEGMEVLGFGLVAGGVVIPVDPAEFERMSRYSSIGSVVGSSLGNYLGGKSVGRGVVFSSLLGEIGERLGAALGAGSLESAIGAAVDGGLKSFGTDVAVRAGQAAIGSVSSWLSMELGEALGLKGFGAELFTTVGTTVTSRVIGNLLNATLGPSQIWSQFTPESTVNPPGSLSSGGLAIANAVGSFLGAKLGAMVVSPQTQAGVALSSIGSAVGGFMAMSGGLLSVAAGAVASAASSLFSGVAAQAIFNTIAPGVGVFIGFVLGALIGNLFGKKKPKVPTASAETVLQIPYARYELGTITVTGNGNRDLVTSMASTARDTLNGLIAMVAYTNTTAYVSNLNGASTTQAYGHDKNLATGQNEIYAKVNGVKTYFASADQAVEFGSLTAIRNTKIVGGDIFAKRVIARSPAADLTSLTGDLQVASDYRFYANNRALVNGFITGAYATLTEAEQLFYFGGTTALVSKVRAQGIASLTPAELTTYNANKALIDKAQTQGTAALTSGELSTYNANKPTIDKIIGALENQALANPWIITLQRVSELGLDKWTTSDFYGGLQGFLSSVDLAGHGVAFENVRAVAQGGAMLVGVRPELRETLTTKDVNSQAAQVYRLYDIALSRTPSAGEIGTWLDYLELGHTIEEATAIMLTDPGVNTRWGALSNLDFIRLCYQSGFRRAPTASEEQIWLSNMAAGWTRPKTLAFFSEYVGHRAFTDTLMLQVSRTTTDVNSFAAQIYRLYDAAMGRAPTVAEIGYWLGYVENGTSLDDATAMMMTDAWVNNRWMTLSDVDFVRLCYQANFRRAAYASEEQAWLTNMAQGWTRPRILAFFSEHAGHRAFTDPTIGQGLAYQDPVGLTYSDGLGRDLFSILPQAAGDGRSVSPELAAIGYAASSGATTSGNDLIDRGTAITGVTLDDSHPEQRWVPPNYHIEGDEGHYTTVTVDGGDDIFVGGAGNDTLYGRTGWDWLDGGAGNDTLYGGAQNDVLLGGAGNDTLFGEDGDDYLAAGDGADNVWGGAGNDTLVDGGGSEAQYGDDGDDTFLISADATFNWFSGGAGSDTASAERLAAGIMVHLDYKPAEWVGSTSPLEGDPTSLAMGVVNVDNYSLSYTTVGLVGVENVTGSQFRDAVAGSSGDNVLKGLDGDDTLYGQDGADTLEGGAGADTLHGGNGSDTLSYAGSTAGVYLDLTTQEAFGGDADGDVFDGVESLRGSKLADQLKGDAGGNRLEGLAGDDWLVATAGADTYDGGEGKDFVDYSEATAGVTLNLGAYTPTGQTTGNGTGGLAASQAYIAVEGVVGSAYADSLSAGDGDQTFIGGVGADYLSGGAGTDTYVLNIGDGADTIVEDTGGWNVLSLGEGVKVSDLIFGTAGGASGWLSLTVRGGNASAYAGGNFADPSNARVKTIDFNGGGQLDIGSIDYGVGGVTDGADTLVGLSGEHYDLIVGLNGNDTIWGRASGQLESKGNVIIGGLGDDVINTSNGDDQFAYDRGDGFDTITDTGGEDTLVFGSTVAAEDVIYQVVGNDLYIGAKDATNAALTASQVADRVKIVGGGVKWVENDPYGQPTGTSFINTVEYVIAGGTSIDLRKLDIAWTVQTYVNYSNYYPIALDLDGDGLDLSTVDGSSVVVRTAQGGLSKLAWVGPTDGFLAVDRDGDGAINKLSEISFVQDKLGATSDLEGLRTWDSNGDGVLDKADRDFSKILLFVDANQNGRSTAKELRTLEQAGIKAINLGGVGTGYTAALTTESFVQNTISFVWADGRTGEGFDVALARRVLGSEGLYAGEYQAEWGARDEDGTLGRLANDPKTAAKAARIQAKKGLLDKLGASYAEVKAAAQLDFSDNDKVDAKIAQRWTKMDASQRVAWLSGQASGMDGQQNLAALKAISSSQALTNALAKGAQAGQDMVANGLAQAGALVSASDPSNLDDGGQAAANGLGVTFGSASSLGGLAASQPLDDVLSASAAIGQDQAWWRGEADGGLSGAGSLAALLATMDQGVGQSTPGALSAADDPALLQQQVLLRQAMAGFGGQTGGSAAVWNRDMSQAAAVLAASGQTTTSSAFSPALVS